MATGREHNRIQLIFRGRYEEAPNYDATLKPGMLARIDADGRIRKHSLVGGGYETLIVDMQLKDGSIVTDTYDGAQDTEVIPYLIPLPGDVLNVLLKDGESVINGVSGLASNGDGTFREADAGEIVHAVAWETKTATGDTLIKARICAAHAAIAGSL